MNIFNTYSRFDNHPDTNNNSGVHLALDHQTLSFTLTSSRFSKTPCWCPAHIKAPERASMDHADEMYQQDTHDIKRLEEPAFTSVEISSTQVIERQEIIQHDSPNTTIPCRADNSGIGMDYRHYINGRNATCSVVPGQIALSFLDSVSTLFPPWSMYGISRIVPIDMDDLNGCWQGWIRLRNNSLPPPRRCLDQRILRLITLDVFWTSNEPDRLSSRLVHTDIATTHSPEFVALMMAIGKVFRGLAREYPLIFSSKNIDSYIRRTQDVANWSESLCRIVSRVTSPRVKQRISTTFQLMSARYPGVPQDNKLLLLECVLESAIYTGIKKGRIKNEGYNVNLEGIEPRLRCEDTSKEAKSDRLFIPEAQFIHMEDQVLTIDDQSFSPEISLSTFCAPSAEDLEMEYDHWLLPDG